MKVASFISKNLIGDALYISPAWNAWYKAHGVEYDRIDMFTLPDHIKRLYYGMGIPVNVITDNVMALEPPTFRHTFDVTPAFRLSDQKQQHLAESYADLLGVELDRKPDKSHLKPIYDPQVVEDYKSQVQPYEGSILISPFSASCSSRGNPPQPPNKMLPWHKWKPILRVIKQYFPSVPVWVLGAPTGDIFPLIGELVGGGYLLGIPLDQLALIMRKCLFVVTIDNGMSHLAASQDAREFVLYPLALGAHYILPWGNKNMKHIHMNPNTVSTAQIVWELQQAWKEWGL